MNTNYKKMGRKKAGKDQKKGKGVKEKMENRIYICVSL